MLVRSWCVVLVVVLFFSAFARGVAKAPSGRWKPNGNAVLDRKTGLTWRRCIAGQHWVHSRCAGSPLFYTWDGAAALTSGGWRLPTPDELVSLVEQDRKQRGLIPTFDPVAFPGIPPGTVMDTWTAYRRDCPTNPEHGCALVVSFGFARGADMWDQPVDLRLPVRLVRGTAAAAGAPQSGDHEAPARVTANGRFEVRGNVARDRHTGLMWQRCDAGRQMTAELGCAGVLHGFTLSQSQHMGTDGWRLPTLDELLTLVDPVRRSKGQAPYIDQEAFPAGPNGIAEYWTSTRYTASGDQMFCVNFHLGTPDNCGPYPQGVRLVHSGGK